MSKPLLGLLLGAGLGALDGLTALFSGPEMAPQILTIVFFSMLKGLVAGLAIGFFARKVGNVGAGVLFGLAMGALFALPIALTSISPITGKAYFWEIMIPGSIVGLIVGFATQRYGVRAPQKA